MGDSDKSLTLYTAGTPNGWKVSITLEELGVPYDARAISLRNNEQKEEWFEKINPNGRIPAIVDHKNGDYPLFESGAVMMYVCDKYGDGTLFPRDDEKARYEVVAWLMFQMGGVGPMQGQANHFLRFAPEKIPYGQQRYINETKRLYRVMDRSLEGKEYLAAGRYTIADIANFSWVYLHIWAGVETLDDYPNLKAWKGRIEQRSAVSKGLDVPEPNKFKEAAANPELMQEIINDVRNFITKTK